VKFICVKPFKKIINKKNFSKIIKTQKEANKMEVRKWLKDERRLLLAIVTSAILFGFCGIMIGLDIAVC